MTFEKATYEQLQKQIDDLKKENEQLRLNFACQQQENEKHAKELQIAKEKAEENEVMFSQILRYSPILMYIKDVNIKAVHLSENFEKLVGIPVKNMIGKSNYDLFPSDFAEKMVDDDKKILIEGKTIEIEEEFAGKYYTTIKFPIFIKNKPLYLAGFSIDITERKHIENELKNSEEKYRKIFNNNIDAVCIFDYETNRILDVNNAYLKLYGYTREEALSLTIFDITCEPEKSYEAVLKTYEFGEILVPERNHKKKDGKIIQVEISGGTFNWNNRKVMFAVTRDITNRKLIEQRIQKQNQELIKLNADKDRFLTILAHDLKSPFIAILGYLEFLSNNINELEINTIDEHIKSIYKSSQQTFQLLEDILMWAMAQSGKIPFKPQDFYLNNVCDEVIETLKPNADNKSITIDNPLSENIKIFADIDMIKTILRNLIGNAIKFTNKNGKIIIKYYIDESNHIITVSDNGIGIEEEKLKKLFDITQIISTNGTDSEKGTGLGLLLCKEFIEKHSGKIWVTSQSGKGSDFTFLIPFKIY